MQLTVQNRVVSGKKNKTLRKQGMVPAVVYGKHVESNLHVQFDKNAFLKIYREAGTSSIITLSGDHTNLVLVKELDVCPVTNNLLHVSFLDVRADEKIEAQIPVSIFGESIVQKQSIGNIEIVKQSITVEALPFDLPHEVKLDISGFTSLDDGIFVRDIDLGPKVTILDDKDLPVVVVTEISAEETTEETASAETA